MNCKHVEGPEPCFECQQTQPVVPISNNGGWSGQYGREQESPATIPPPDLHISIFGPVPNLQHDTIDWPKHYNRGSIQMTDYVVDQKLGWCSGNVVKYVVRSRHKGQRLQDLKKAKWYLDKLIGIVEAGGEE